MNDELIWMRETPFKIKFPVLLGLYTTRIMGVFFYLLLAASFVRMLRAPYFVHITFLTSQIHTYHGEPYYCTRFIIALIYSLIHAFSSTGIRFWRDTIYPIVLIISYILIFLVTLLLQSFILAFISLILIALWFVCLWGLSCFHEFKAEYIKSHTIKDFDPYCLITPAFKKQADKAAVASDDPETSSRSFFSSYGNELIDPIHIDHAQLKATKNSSKDKDEPIDKQFF